MRLLLDTNVVSELAKVEPNRRVTDWFSKLDQEGIYVSVITLGEIRKGIELLIEGSRRRQLTLWLERDLTDQFEGRILNIDWRVADLWGSLSSKSKRTLPAVDGLIAATALVHKLKLVTRNTKDFDYPGLSVINPWD